MEYTKTIVKPLIFKYSLGTEWCVLGFKSRMDAFVCAEQFLESGTDFAKVNVGDFDCNFFLSDEGRTKLASLCRNENILFDYSVSISYFPVNFDDWWVEVGYTSRSDYEYHLHQYFNLGKDYAIVTNIRGSYYHVLTLDCFKYLLIRAPFKKAAELIRYQLADMETFIRDTIFTRYRSDIVSPYENDDDTLTEDEEEDKIPNKIKKDNK